MVINCFSTAPLKTKSDKDVVKAMRWLILESVRGPRKRLQTDQSKEFYNAKTHDKSLISNATPHSLTRNHTKHQTIKMATGSRSFLWCSASLRKTSIECEWYCFQGIRKVSRKVKKAIGDPALEWTVNTAKPKYMLKDERNEELEICFYEKENSGCVL